MKKDLVKSFLIYGVGSSLSKFIGLFLLPVYTRVFSPYNYGAIDLIQSVTAIVAILAMLQLDSAIQRFYYDVTNEYQRKKYISTTFFSILILSIVFVSLMYIFSKNISIFFFNDIQYNDAIIISSFKIPFSNIFVLFSVIIRYLKKPFVYTIYVLVQFVLTLSLSIWLVVYIETGIIGVFWGQLLGIVTVTVLMLIQFRRYIIFSFGTDAIKELLKFAIPSLPTRLGSIANTYANRFIIFSYLSVSDIGLFTIALKFASIFMLIQAAFANAFYPFFYEIINQKNSSIILVKLSKYVTIGIFALAVMLGMFSRELLILLSTIDYYAAAPLIGILGFANGLIIISNTTNLGHLITKKTIYGTYSYIISSVLNILLMLLAINDFGLLAVPISLLVSNTILLILGWYFSERLHYIGFKKLFFAVVFSSSLLLIILNNIYIINIYIKIVFCLSIAILTLIYILNDNNIFKKYTFSS